MHFILDALKTLVRKGEVGHYPQWVDRAESCGQILRNKTHANSSRLWAEAAALFTHQLCQLRVESSIWSVIPLVSLSREMDSEEKTSGRDADAGRSEYTAGDRENHHAQEQGPG